MRCLGRNVKDAVFTHIHCQSTHHYFEYSADRGIGLFVLKKPKPLSIPHPQFASGSIRPYFVYMWASVL